MRPLSSAPLLALLLALPGWLGAGEQIFRREYQDHPGTFVEVESVFGPITTQGSLPYRITVRNHSGRPRNWTVRFVEGNTGRPLSTEASWRIEVADGALAVREVTFPFAPSHLAYQYRNLQIEVSADGLGTETRGVGGQAPDEYPQLAISGDLALRSLGRLDDLVKKRHSGNGAFAKRFDPAHLPGDWLGYTALDGMLLDRRAWDSLSTAQRQAIADWVQLGGSLHLFAEEPAKLSWHGLDLQTPRGQKETHPFGLGSVRAWSWNGRELPDDIVGTFRSIPRRSQSLRDDYSSTWKLPDGLGPRDFNATPVFLLLVAFAILVAPVNLFYLARPGRRHRLFVTTPIISVGTCLLIVLFIFFVDGVGGRGWRAVLADLQPSENRLYTTQEQASRTGVIVSPGFSSDRLFDISPVNLPAGPFNPFSRNSQRPATFEISGGRYAGEFFRSRSEQGYALRCAEPSRARIEFAGLDESRPVLVSNLPQEIVAILYRDPAGVLWTGPEGATFGPGGSIHLVETGQEVVPDWFREVAEAFGADTRKRIEALAADRNRFFARVRDEEDYALATHPSLRWERTFVLLTGTPLGGAGSAPSPPATASDRTAPEP